MSLRKMFVAVMICSLVIIPMFSKSSAAQTDPEFITDDFSLEVVSREHKVRRAEVVAPSVEAMNLVPEKKGFTNLNATNTSEYAHFGDGDLAERNNIYWPFFAQYNEENHILQITSKTDGELSFHRYGDTRLDSVEVASSAKDKSEPVFSKSVKAGDICDIFFDEMDITYQIHFKEENRINIVNITNNTTEYGPWLVMSGLNSFELAPSKAETDIGDIDDGTEVSVNSVSIEALAEERIYPDTSYSRTIPSGSTTMSFYFYQGSTGYTNVFLDVSQLPSTCDIDLHVTVDGRTLSSELYAGNNELVVIGAQSGRYVWVEVKLYSGSCNNKNFILRYNDYTSGTKLYRPAASNVYVSYYYDLGGGVGYNGGLSYSGHTGTDFAYNGNSFTVYASAPGIAVSRADTTQNVNPDVDPNKRGQYVEIQHAGSNFSTTRYLHFASWTGVFSGVNQTRTVYANNIIGNAGNTGSSTGTHLHFAVANNYGTLVCPYKNSMWQ